jgi:hypothetical protein
LLGAKLLAKIAGVTHAQSSVNVSLAIISLNGGAPEQEAGITLVAFLSIDDQRLGACRHKYRTVATNYDNGKLGAI